MIFEKSSFDNIKYDYFHTKWLYRIHAHCSFHILIQKNHFNLGVPIHCDVLFSSLKKKGVEKGDFGWIGFIDGIFLTRIVLRLNKSLLIWQRSVGIFDYECFTQYSLICAWINDKANNSIVKVSIRISFSRFLSLLNVIQLISFLCLENKYSFLYFKY